MTTPALHNVKLKPRKGMGPETRLRTKRSIAVMADLMRSETARGYQPKQARGRV